MAEILLHAGETREAFAVLEELSLHFEQTGDVPARVAAYSGMADVLMTWGELNRAWTLLQHASSVVEPNRHARQRAVVRNRMADILQTRGQWDEALRIRREEVLPVLDRWEDERERARTMREIADVLDARGDLDEALRIRRHEELPVYERLDDVREGFVVLSKIEDLLHAQGQTDEAARVNGEAVALGHRLLGDDAQGEALVLSRFEERLITRQDGLDHALMWLRQKVLPAFVHQGDVRGRAATLGKIADALQVQGHLDLALRIRREEQLPIYERLGDVWQLARASGRIADILQAQGQIDEALRIRREEQLPVFERLRCPRDICSTQIKLAHGLYLRNAESDREQARLMLAAALATAQLWKFTELAEVQRVLESWERDTAADATAVRMGLQPPGLDDQSSFRPATVGNGGSSPH
jgi:tetratricopeptide (TPR) repeat protein